MVGYEEPLSLGVARLEHLSVGGHVSQTPPPKAPYSRLTCPRTPIRYAHHYFFEDRRCRKEALLIVVTHQGTIHTL